MDASGAGGDFFINLALKTQTGFLAVLPHVMSIVGYLVLAAEIVVKIIISATRKRLFLKLSRNDRISEKARALEVC